MTSGPQNRGAPAADAPTPPPPGELERLQAGDAQVLESLVDELYPTMTRLAHSLLGEASQARDLVQETWVAVMDGLARFEGLHVKLGGLGMALAGYGLHERASPPASAELAELWGPAIDACIDLFGTERCMFESNFPVDKASCGYGVLWNAFKRLAARHGERERDALFRGNAARFYRL